MRNGLVRTFVAAAWLAPLPAAADWTPLSPAPDARIVYVSASQGNDANDRLSEGSAKATIAAGSRRCAMDTETTCCSAAATPSRCRRR